MIPGFLDHYLASKAYDGQHTDEPEQPHRPDNLLAPLPGDHGAHGRFDQRAQGHSLQLWLAIHRLPWVSALMLAVVAAAAAILLH